MIKEKEYNEILSSLKEIMTGASDAVAVTAYPYQHFIKTDGTIDKRRGNFRCEIVIFTMAPAERMAEIFSDTFSRISRWMKQHSEEYNFEYTLSTKANEVKTFQFTVSFDNAKDAAISYLLK